MQGTGKAACRPDKISIINIYKYLRDTTSTGLIYLKEITRVFNYVILILILLYLTGPASATAGISGFFSDFTSSDVTIISDEDFNGSVLFELYHTGSAVQSQKIPVRVKAGETGYRVIVWQQRPQQDYYTAKVSLYNNNYQLLDTKTYPVSYGTVSLPGFHVIGFLPSNSGVKLLIRPFNPGVADIKIELLDNNNAVYTKIERDVSLTTNTEKNFNWPFLLSSGKNYNVRAKIYTQRLYFEPMVNTYVSEFTATEDIEILYDDVQVDEFGASVTIMGNSQVPFDGYIVVNTKNRETGEMKTYRQQMDEILVSGKEDTSGVVWGDIAPGVYDVEILAVNHDNKTLDKYETVLRIPEIPVFQDSSPQVEAPGFIIFLSVISLLLAARSRRGR